MAKNHFYPEETLRRLEPADMGLVYTSVQRLELGESTVYSEQEETCLVIIQGEALYQYGELSGTAVYCDMLYLPVGRELTLHGSDTVVIRYGAPCKNNMTLPISALPMLTKIHDIRFMEKPRMEHAVMYGTLSTRASPQSASW
jgi:5-deoxy-D-glucuronate isomerase